MIILVKTTLYAGILFSAGMFFGKALFIKRKERKIFDKKIIFFFSVLALFSSVLFYFLRTVSLFGFFNIIENYQLLGVLLQTSEGMALLIRLFGLVLILTATFFCKMGTLIGVIGGFISLSSFTQIGHTVDAKEFYLSFFLFFHLIFISLWAGFLFPLYVVSKKKYLRITFYTAVRFGKQATIFIPILFLSGLFLSYYLVGSFRDILFTSYGQVLMIKILITISLLSIGALNKLKFVPDLKKRGIVSMEKLNKLIFLEILLILLIMFVASILSESSN